jgi:hypothetical protein
MEVDFLEPVTSGAKISGSDTNAMVKFLPSTYSIMDAPTEVIIL